MLAAQIIPSILVAVDSYSAMSVPSLFSFLLKCDPSFSDSFLHHQLSTRLPSFSGIAIRSHRFTCSQSTEQSTPSNSSYISLVEHGQGLDQSHVTSSIQGAEACSSFIEKTSLFCAPEHWKTTWRDRRASGVPHCKVGPLLHNVYKLRPSVC